MKLMLKRLKKLCVFTTKPKINDYFCDGNLWVKKKKGLV